MEQYNYKLKYIVAQMCECIPYVGVYYLWCVLSVDHHKLNDMV